MFILPMLAEDGTVTAIRVISTPAKDNLVIPAQNLSGACGIKISSMKAEGDIGFAGLSVDGVDVALTAKSAPWAASIIIVFIDESNSIYYPSGHDNWNEDVSRWNNLINEYGPPRYAMLNHVPPTAGYDAYDIKPTGTSMPGGIVYGRDVPRSPDLQKFIDLYKYCIGGGDLNPDPDDTPSDPKELVILVDNSGSMKRATLEPGIDEFEAWLSNPDNHESGEAVNWKYVSFSTERWLGMIVDWMINTYLPNMEEQP